ncbi:MAG: hypothetical protein ACR2HN_14030, partial [Tepidiformaceae bacterium]
LEEVAVQTATQEPARGELCGPICVRLEGFRQVFTEVLFIDMEPDNGEYEPIIGDLVLEAIPVVVDMVGQRLVKTLALLK